MLAEEDSCIMWILQILGSCLEAWLNLGEVSRIFIKHSVDEQQKQDFALRRGIPSFNLYPLVLDVQSSTWTRVVYESQLRVPQFENDTCLSY